MHGLRVEHRRIAKGKTLSADLAQHFNNRRGLAIVVTNKPVITMSAVKKQWLKLEYKLKIERARSLNRELIHDLCEQLVYMENIKFSATPPGDLLDADITFATADDFVATSSVCRTTYVTCDFAPIKLHMLTSWMPRSGLVVVYDK